MERVEDKKFWARMAVVWERVLDDDGFESACENLRRADLATHDEFVRAWKTLWYSTIKRIDPNAYREQQAWHHKRSPRKKRPALDRQAIYQRDGGRCWICGEEVGCKEGRKCGDPGQAACS